MLEMLGPLISAGTSIFGGLMGKSAQDDANRIAQENAQRNIDMQMKFAQNGIQWRVADAKAAGIHPLYALGSGGASFSPVSITQDSSNPMGKAIADAGQDFSRAINATRDAPGRTKAVLETQAALQTQNMSLQNELLAAQIRKINGPAVGPPMPTNTRWGIEGQGQTAGGPLIQDQPLKRTIWDTAGPPSNEPGSIRDVGYSNTVGQGYYPVPSQDIKERIEDNFWHETAHFIRNNVMPAFQMRMNPPYPAPKGSAWLFDPLYGYKLIHDRDTQAAQSKFNRYMDYITGRR